MMKKIEVFTFKKALFPILYLFLVLIFYNCSRTDESEPNGYEVSLVEHIVAPEETFTGINTRSGNHIAILPEYENQRIGDLMVFFPGTGARPEWYNSFVKRAAQNGFHTISLDYENSQSINFDVCPDQPQDCHEASRLEILTGEDSPYLVPDVDRNNSVYNRLHKLLKFLAAKYPDEGWDSYFSVNSEEFETSLHWESIVFAGHSQGGGHAAMTAKLYEIKRVIMFGATEPAIWTLQTFTTPSNRFWGLVHKKEPIFNGIINSWNNIGIPGELAEVETGQPEIQTQRLATVAEGGAGDPQSNAYYHNLYIVDGWMPAPSKDGTPAFAPVWDYLLTTPSIAQTVQKAQKISPAGISWIDPEILNRENKIAFQVGGSGVIWLSNLDPTSGHFVNPAGTDIFIDNGATPLSTSINGPEFGIDANGWAIFYTKDNGGTPQPWRAIVNGTSVTTVPLNSGSIPRLSTLASKDENANSIRLLYGKGTALNNSKLAWMDEDNASSETVVDSIDTGVRWIDGTQQFVYAKQTGPHAGQLSIYDTENRTETIITNDSGRKTYSYGWLAPEYNELLVLCVVNESTIGIYKDNGGSFWDRIITLEAPLQAGSYRYFGSPEPFVANNKSFISFVLKPVYTTSFYIDAEVWVIDIEPDPGKRFMLRCDDGIPNTIRSDPESYIGEKEVFIYYNQINPQGEFEIWRYATGIQLVYE